jgi:hypothetical protein
MGNCEWEVRERFGEGREGKVEVGEHGKRVRVVNKHGERARERGEVGRWRVEETEGKMKGGER